MSHGLTELPPMRIDQDARALEITLPVPGGRPRTVPISAGGAGVGVVRVAGPPPGPRTGERLAGTVRHIPRLDEPLAAFYAITTLDAELAW